MVYDGVETRVSAGQAILIDPGKRHQIVNDTGAELSVFSVWWS
jgi:mannose-6-phosphate isomerase-like protein (cupin superfamily)